MSVLAFSVYCIGLVFGSYTFEIPVFYLLHCGPTRAMASSFLSFLDHNQAQHGQKVSSGWTISSLQRPLPDNITLTTDFHTPDGIRTCNPRKRVALDLLPRPRVHWDRLRFCLLTQIIGFTCLKILTNPLNARAKIFLKHSVLQMYCDHRVTSSLIYEYKLN